MNSVIYKFPRSSNPLEEACNWLAKIDRNLTADEERELRAWLHADANNVELFTQTAKMWDKLDSLQYLVDAPVQTKEQQSKAEYYRWGLAATVLVAVLVGFWSYFDLGPSYLARPSESTTAASAQVFTPQLERSRQLLFRMVRN